MVVTTLLIRWAAAAALLAPAAAEIRQETTGPDGMKYLVSRPAGWTAGKTYPVLLAIESANAEFEKTAALFEKERGTLPLLIVVPWTTTNGGRRYLDGIAGLYPDSTWRRVNAAGNCEFDDQGLLAVIAQVQKQHGGEDRVFLTGWEAGGHTVFAFAFRHPDRLRGVAPVSPNYAGRCEQFSAAASRATLPFHVFEAGRAELTQAGQPFYLQARKAVETAAAQGFHPDPVEVVKDADHTPLAGPVVRWVAGLLGVRH